MATTTIPMAQLHIGARDQLQRKQLHSRTHANTNGRKAFYDVSDALQETGNRGRAFDTIVLETSAETGEFERYVVFKQHVPKPILPMATSISSAAAAAALYAVSHNEQECVVPEVVPEHIRVDATFILYNIDTERFYSDGAYHKHTFCTDPETFTSVSDEHIANEKFKLYKQCV